ncbi:MAG TPA: hypothetical protein VLH56_14420, partial [Dissulfurispiraceae bacterium]|nr:hypothetical protein [Dissulfurispiraceae bacterium]
MKLLTLKLKNFKGIRDFTLDIKGEDAEIKADNAKGKTTIADAFYFVLFGKDSLDRKEFPIKTTSPDGIPIHNLEHSVEAVLKTADGNTITLEKVFKEKWTKKRGEAMAEFTGHTTDYYIDDVPVPQKDYQARIAQVVDEEVFRLLTSPRYFTEVLHWQKRREILLSICGDITDTDVIASSRDMAELPDILGNRKMDDHRKIVRARRTEINRELDRIPVRIDEATRALPDITGLDGTHLEQGLVNVNHTIQEKQRQLSRIESGGEIAEKQKALREMEAQALDVRNRAREETDRLIQIKKTELNKKLDEVDRLKRELLNIHGQISSNETETRRLERLTEELRQKWHQVN